MWLALLAMIFVPKSVQAEILETAGAIYQPPPQAVSCQMLRHREREREKVIREQVELKGPRATLVNQLLTNKLFMPGDTWRDETVNVRVAVKITEAMSTEIERLGLDGIYLRVSAPGLTWESYAFQTPRGLDYALDEDSQLILTYMTYQNVLCLEKLDTPVVEWVPADLAPGRPN